MKGIITLILTASSFYGYSQTIEKQVIGSMGGISSGGNIELDCTVGEAVVDTLSSGSILLYQGYHHANDSNRNTAIKEIPLSMNYVLYPNPTREKATLKISGVSIKSNLTIQVFSITGKLISTQDLEINNLTESSAQIDVGQESSGVYFIRITDTQSNYTHSLRLVKS